VLHPGAMGVAVARALRASGQRVLWVSQGRSPQSAERARAAGLEDAGELPALVAASGAIVSVCPPASAEEVARQVAQLGFRGRYVDANALSPESTRRIAAICAAVGAQFIDGGIIGVPPTRPGMTRLYLSGKAAAQIAALFAGSWLEPRVVDDEIGSASALKMAYAAYTKGQTALLAAIQAMARSYGVAPALLEEWSLSQPELAAHAAVAVSSSAPKAWRFAAEMEEIAATFRAAGLPGGFHEAAAEIYRRLSGFKDSAAAPLDAVLAALVAGVPPAPRPD
jgi:3-hydroxyisobutyrate dehydrogenase-like beta-hydroxyacid dehydrogenase